MSGSRRRRASWLLLVLFTGISLGVCTATLSAGGKLPCCEDRADGQPSLTACCPLGQESSPLDLQAGLQSLLPPVSEIAFDVAPKTSCDVSFRRDSFSSVPYRFANPQAFLSIFLI